jgi:small subunit ribosomal protein S20
VVEGDDVEPMAARSVLRVGMQAMGRAMSLPWLYEIGDKKAAAAALVRSQAVIDRTAAKRIVHRNAAARQKSRLAHAIKAMA